MYHIASSSTIFSRIKYSGGNEVESHLSENERNVDFGLVSERKVATQKVEGFRTLLNTNSRESSETKAERVKIMNSEITSQGSSKLNEFKIDLNIQICGSIEQAMLDQVLTTFWNTVEGAEKGSRINIDLRSSELHRSPEVEIMKRS